MSTLPLQSAFVAITLFASTTVLAAQQRINVQPECGTQNIIDYDFQIFFQIKGPDGKVYSIMVRLSEATGDEAMALAISQAINDATGSETKTEEAKPGKPDLSQEDVVLEAGWCFVQGSLYKYKLVNEAWLSKSSGQCDIDVDYDDGKGVQNEKQNSDPDLPSSGKPFNDAPPGNWPNRNW
ncbi:MAG TPA: hypothetical protein PKE00_06815 [Planctomycetota bacterium]|nr:hypothetical protein [Planctomycetota bacterium]